VHCEVLRFGQGSTIGPSIRVVSLSVPHYSPNFRTAELIRPRYLNPLLLFSLIRFLTAECPFVASPPSSPLHFPLAKVGFLALVVFFRLAHSLEPFSPFRRR